MLSQGTYHQVYTLQQVLEHWWIAAVALGASLIATPICRWVAYRFKIVDRPDALLKPHGRPIAYLGGVGICTGLLAGLAISVAVLPDLGDKWQSLVTSLSKGDFRSVLHNPIWNLSAIAVASVLIMLVGLIDDLRNITPNKKLLGQVLAAAVLLLGGIAHRMAIVVTSPLLGPMSDYVVVPLSMIMCVLMVIAACNATNLIDGLDGLCGGVTWIIALGFLLLASYLATWDQHPGADQLRVVLSLAMAGAIVGFLPYNVPPASIFMGDAGSMLIGFFVATMMALFCQQGNLRWLAGACMIFALPILDTGLAVVRRLISGKGIFVGDRSHLYDQLVDRGMSVKQVVYLFYLLAAAAAVAGVMFAISMRFRVAMPLYVAIFLAAFLLFYLTGMLRPEKQNKSAKPEEEPQEAAPRE